MTRKTMLWISALVVTVVIGVALAVFQPQKLLIDQRVDEALPPAAAPAGPAPAATASAVVAPADVTPADVTPVPTAASVPGPARANSAPPVFTPVRGGAFRGLEHPGSGTATLLPVGSAYVVRLEDLAVENGPDLYVYLSPATSDSKAAAFDAGHLSLGKLKGNKGNQNYAVPTGVDLSKYKSVVVWCRRFSAGFAVAPVA